MDEHDDYQERLEDARLRAHEIRVVSYNRRPRSLAAAGHRAPDQS